MSAGLREFRESLQDSSFRLRSYFWTRRHRVVIRKKEDRVPLDRLFAEHNGSGKEAIRKAGASAIKCWQDDAKTLRCIKLQPK